MRNRLFWIKWIYRFTRLNDTLRLVGPCLWWGWIYIRYVTYNKERCGTLKRAVWYFKNGGVILEEGGVILWRGWCDTLKRVMWYFGDGGVVLWRGWCATLKRVVWYFKEGDVVTLKRMYLICVPFIVYVHISWSSKPGFWHPRTFSVIFIVLPLRCLSCITRRRRPHSPLTHITPPMFIMYNTTTSTTFTPHTYYPSDVYHV